MGMCSWQEADWRDEGGRYGAEERTHDPGRVGSGSRGHGPCGGGRAEMLAMERWVSESPPEMEEALQRAREAARAYKARQEPDAAPK